MGKKFRIRLKPYHDATGKSPYAVADELGLSKNTVRRYVEQDDVLVGRLDPSVLILAAYYGCSWQEVVDVIDADDEGELKTPIAIPA